MPPVSDTVAGLVLIVCGVGMLWSARTHFEVTEDVRRGIRRTWERRYGRPPPWWVGVTWQFGSRRVSLAIAYALAAAAIVGGFVLLLS